MCIYIYIYIHIHSASEKLQDSTEHRQRARVVSSRRVLQNGGISYLFIVGSFV